MNEPDRPVDAAIARVLEAEGAARAAIVECEREAQVILTDARNCERRITERAMRRIGKIRARMIDRLSAQLGEIADEPVTAELDALLETATHTRIEHAVARLIDELTDAST